MKTSQESGTWTNAAGRVIPLKAGSRTLIPYQGIVPRVFQPELEGARKRLRRAIRDGNDKMQTSLEDAVRAAALRDGMTVSFHHHLRNGDLVINDVLALLDRMGFRRLRLASTALFPAQETVVDHIRSGLIDRIESSCNGPVGDYVSHHPLKEPVVLRSHGGRARAIATGELHIDVAFIAASAADVQGNCTGLIGPSSFGPLSTSSTDAWFADHVIVVTDNIVPYPCIPMSIQECYVDQVVKVDDIGNPQGISSGSLEVTRDPLKLGIARDVVRFIEEAGYLKDGLSFQAGAGGISLAVVKFLHERMKEKKVVGDFVLGGVTGLATAMLEDGTIRAIADGQDFDMAGIESLRSNPAHVESTAYHLMNPITAGCLVHNIDFSFLGATEVDIDFNVNVNTHSDGRLLHGTGGHQDAAEGAEITLAVAPVHRKAIPVIRDRVTTITSPGDVVDVVVTDHGIAVNPRRADLLEKVQDSDLPLRKIEELRDLAYELGGQPPVLEFTDEIVAIIEYRDGTVIDVVRKVKSIK